MHTLMLLLVLRILYSNNFFFYFFKKLWLTKISLIFIFYFLFIIQNKFYICPNKQNNEFSNNKYLVVDLRTTNVVS